MDSIFKQPRRPSLRALAKQSRSGEGRSGLLRRSAPRNDAKMRLRDLAAFQFPPPCGEGLGRGVAASTAFSAYPSPQPSPTRGEGADFSAPPHLAYIFKQQRTLQPQLRVLAARSREFCHQHPALQSEGAGNAGRTMHPQPRMQNKMSTRASSPRSHREHPAFPTQWF
jgi:hypothetical protein